MCEIIGESSKSSNWAKTLSSVIKVMWHFGVGFLTAAQRHTFLSWRGWSCWWWWWRCWRWSIAGSSSNSATSNCHGGELPAGQHSAHQDTNRYLLLQLLQLLLHPTEQSSTETILRAAQRPLMLPIPQTYTHRTHFRIVLQDLGADDEDGGLAAQCWLSGCVARAKTIPFLGLLLSFAGPR